MRLIDADACSALFDAEFKETKRLIIDGEKHLDNLAEGFMEAHNVIRSMPTIDAAPVVHGYWILKHIGAGHTWECSCCHKQPCIYITKDTNYCPNCGAKMDMEQE